MELHGFKELDDLLRRLPEKVARKHLADAVREGGELIRQEVEDQAPVDTGELADSIVLRIARQRNTGGDPRAEIGPTKEEAHIARFNELGTAHQGARPFMRPALEAKGPEAIARMGEVLAQRLEQEKAE